jgi:broad specificity phosphatase PhoE
MKENNICNLYLVRHGETDWNRKKLLQGSTDIPLNETGKSQAKTLQGEFASVTFDAVYSSDLLRARETAEIISHGKNLKVITTSSLRERSWGTHEGQNFDELKLKYGEAFHPVIDEFEYDIHKLHPELTQVESYSQAINRVIPYLMNIQTEFKGKSVLVVSHGGILKGLLLYLKLQEFKKPYVNNTAYLHFEAHDTHLTLKAHQGVTQH